MVDEARYSADILTQVSWVQEALRAIARALMRNYLTHCTAQRLYVQDQLRNERLCMTN